MSFGPLIYKKLLSIESKDVTIFHSYLRRLDVDGLEIEHDLGSRLRDLRIDGNFAIVGPRVAELQVKQRQVIMRRFHPEFS